MEALPKDKQKLIRKARNSVFQLLKVRLRSEMELRQKLKQKNYNAEIINETIEYFKQLEFIDDRQFTKAWITSRLKKPYGSSRIRYELRNKGIHKNIIDEEIRLAIEDENYSELRIIEDLARRRLEKYLSIDDQKKKQRVFAYLSRRGFNSANILKVLNKI